MNRETEKVKTFETHIAKTAKRMQKIKQRFVITLKI